MNIIVSGRQIKLTEEIKSYIDIKLSRLEKYLNQESQVKVTISENRDMQKVEMTIIPLNGPIVRAEQVQDDLYVAIDIVYDKLYMQLEKYKNRTQDKTQSNRTTRIKEEYILKEDSYFCEDEDSFVIERWKKFNIKPMSHQEAILQMELIGHTFYMFRNQDTYEINVAYKRDSGGYGIIEHE